MSRSIPPRLGYLDGSSVQKTVPEWLGMIEREVKKAFKAEIIRTSLIQKDIPPSAFTRGTLMVTTYPGANEGFLVQIATVTKGQYEELLSIKTDGACAAQDIATWLSVGLTRLGLCIEIQSCKPNHT